MAAALTPKCSQAQVRYLRLMFSLVQLYSERVVALFNMHVRNMDSSQYKRDRVAIELVSIIREIGAKEN